MGLIARVFGAPTAVATLAQSARDIAEVFTPNATRAMELSHEGAQAALTQYGAEFGLPSMGLFDRVINGLNRLPRPLLAFGTIALFVYAMYAPEGFAQRMQGLAYVPEPLWWLLGAIVAFYFGAREIHHQRFTTRGTARPPIGAPKASDNAALSLLIAQGGDP